MGTPNELLRRMWRKYMKIIDLTHTIDENTLNFRGNPGCCFRTIWDYE
ncbi:MAG: hypothetical protein KC550_07345 [Nanoarchaeota archaeon]|nr:hypothetical protein [Nanoarchaeota archaeon]